jgi:diguanylate cyclase (GGDEF)-like protein
MQAEHGEPARPDVGRALLETSIPSEIEAEPLRDALEHAAPFAVALDPMGQITFANARARELLAGEANGVVVEHLRQQIAALGSGTPTVRSEQQLGAADGSDVRVQWSSSAYGPHGSDPRGLLAIGHDVTEAFAREQELISRALHDPLTQLPNRALLADRLSQALLTADRESVSCALLVLDLDRFKSLNDRRGHAAGDDLLRQIGPRIQAQLRGADTVARIGGDEFAILLPPPSDLLAALAAAQKVRVALATPFLIEGEAETAEASIGVAIFPDHARDADGLRRTADLAMYTAKRTSRDIAVYDAQDDLGSPFVLDQIDHLKRAISGNDLSLEYQACRDLRTGAVARAEALVRWDHPSRGQLLPGAFLPLAERTGLMKPLLAWVLTHALRACASWRASGSTAGVSVNLTLRDLLDPELPGMTSAALRSAGIPAQSLTFELNERQLVGDTRRIERAFGELGRTGVRLALDDFGRGDLSIRSLRSLPLDEVKLDRQMVGSLGSDAASWSFVRAGIDLGHDLGLQVVAKGVEDVVTRDLLTRLGCDVGQGYFFARPIGAGGIGRSIGAA